MARLLVVSRSMALAMRIADDHDVVEYPVERLDELVPGPDVEVVVLDLGEASAAMQAFDRLRERGSRTPVLMVSGYQPAWKDLVDLEIEGLVVVPLPITRAALLDGVDQLLGRIPRRRPQPRSQGPATPSAAPSAPSSARSSAPSSTPPAGESPVEVLMPAGRPSAGGRPGATPVGATAGAANTGEAGATQGGNDVGGGEGRRSGFGRWLSGTGLTGLRSPTGAPTDTPPALDRPVPRTTTAGSPAPPPAPGAGPEPDLFRPVVEPKVPARSASARPRSMSAAPSVSASPPPAAQPPSRVDAARTPAKPSAPDVAGPPAPDVVRGPSAQPATHGPTPAGAAGPAVLRSRPASPASPSTPPAAPATPPAATPAGRSAAPASPVAPVTPARPPASPASPAAPAASSGGAGTGRGRTERRAEGHPGFTPVAGLHAPDPEQPDEIQTWVRGLLDRRSQLFGVAETAQVLADEVVERGESDAAVVLIPDGARWRVSGGVGLRPLERRLRLDTTHWLISEIALGGRALLIEDTDIVRPRLAGAPLAAWRHLLAVPVPGIRAAVVLARGQEAARFTERDLSAVVPVVTEAGPLLTAALQMRDLARALAPLQDVEDGR